jgi:hypothetical protein
MYFALLVPVEKEKLETNYLLNFFLKRMSNHRKPNLNNEIIYNMKPETK